MKLHLPALAHAVTRSDFSHCAFSGKILRFSPMLRAQGFEVIHYGAAGAESGANEQVDLMTTEEHLGFLGIKKYHEDQTAFVGDKAILGTPLYTHYNYRLRDELIDRVEPGDVICLPFGHAHENAIRNIDVLKSGEAVAVETGIGYPNPCTIRRVFESQAWRHWTMGKEEREGNGWGSPRMEWVIPNYYRLDEWPVVTEAELTAEDRRTVVFFGRICESKGAALIPQLARAHPGLRFVMCGQGDPTPYLGEPNVEYRAPIQGRDRAAFLGHAAVGIFPSRMVEPFCGAAVETMMTGTAVLTGDFGAFVETNVEGVTGFRCADERAFIESLPQAMELPRAEVAESARARFATDVIGPHYARVFDQVARTMRHARPLVAV
jgi:glycosyltransferase involved in cell wall biosynthesis